VSWSGAQTLPDAALAVCAMGPVEVVADSPVLEKDSGLEQGLEELAVQAQGILGRFTSALKWGNGHSLPSQHEMQLMIRGNCQSANRSPSRNQTIRIP